MARVLLSIPDDLLERIDREARRQQRSRSAFLQDAARRSLGRPDPITMQRALSRARAALERSGPLDSTALIRESREAQDRRDRRR
ncbi:MAG: ribbon-helix-helix protein, CopG family [Candidatus Dormibacteria bacterium]